MPNLGPEAQEWMKGHGKRRPYGYMRWRNVLVMSVVKEEHDSEPSATIRDNGFVLWKVVNRSPRRCRMCFDFSFTDGKALWEEPGYKPNGSNSLNRSVPGTPDDYEYFEEDNCSAAFRVLSKGFETVSTRRSDSSINSPDARSTYWGLSKTDDPKPARAFVSYSRQDRDFVEKLVDDLKRHGVDVCLDRHELATGGSIVKAISDAIQESSYLIVALSADSVKSKWVQAELDAALMSQLSEGGIVVLPVVIEECEVPALLKAKLYADFRREFDSGLKSLLDILLRESVSAARASEEELPEGTGDESSCYYTLIELSLAELRKRMSKRLSRTEVGTLWFDLFEESIEDAIPGREKVECVIGLIEKCRQRKRLSELVRRLCESRSDLAADL